jgi:hypothetical protein
MLALPVILNSDLYWEKRAEFLINRGKHRKPSTSFLVIISAAKSGCEDIIRYLLTIINPLYVVNKAIKFAAERGHLNIIKILFEYPISKKIHPINLTKAMMSIISKFALLDRSYDQILSILLLAYNHGHSNTISSIINNLKISHELIYNKMSSEYINSLSDKISAEIT